MELHVKREIIKSQGRSFIFSRELYNFLKPIGDSESVQQILFSLDLLKNSQVNIFMSLGSRISE